MLVSKYFFKKLLLRFCDDFCNFWQKSRQNKLSCLIKPRILSVATNIMPFQGNRQY
jgi:hypothetical protein